MSPYILLLGMQILLATIKNIMEVTQRGTMGMPYDPAILLQPIYRVEIKTGY